MQARSRCLFKTSCSEMEDFMEINTGLIHIYHGDGKGKTTCATGLAVRCAGGGGKVLYYQFLKNGSSGEINILKNIFWMEVKLHFGSI